MSTQNHSKQIHEHCSRHTTPQCSGAVPTEDQDCFLPLFESELQTIHFQWEKNCIRLLTNSVSQMLQGTSFFKKKFSFGSGGESKVCVELGQLVCGHLLMSQKKSVTLEYISDSEKTVNPDFFHFLIVNIRHVQKARKTREEDARSSFTTKRATHGFFNS